MRGSVLEVCEFYDDLMDSICDICHRPFQAIDDEELESLFCSKCKVASIIDVLKEEELG